MSFDGPGERDFANVAALNAAYLALLRTESTLRRGLAACRPPLQDRLVHLTHTEIHWLSATPFLLFSFRERDDAYWDDVLDPRPDQGLFRSSGSESVDTLVDAALGFIWQLANRNPYALRLVCGATLYWCERIAELTFFGLLDAVRNAGDVPLLRHGHSDSIWMKLLRDGVHADLPVRRAAQLTALQSVLTDPPPPRHAQTWPLAAKRVGDASVRIAEARNRAKP